MAAIPDDPQTLIIVGVSNVALRFPLYLRMPDCNASVRAEYNCSHAIGDPIDAIGGNIVPCGFWSLQPNRFRVAIIRIGYFNSVKYAHRLSSEYQRRKCLPRRGRASFSGWRNFEEHRLKLDRSTAPQWDYQFTER
jgi:hypothetical protein